MKRKRMLALVQGIYYLVTGIWPIIDMNSFIRVTGPKESLWLVVTVGVLILVTGLVLLTAAVRGRIGPEIVLLAIGDAAGLAIVEIVYAIEGRIGPIYLLDAAIQVILIIAWVKALLVRKPVPEEPAVEPAADR